MLQRVYVNKNTPNWLYTWNELGIGFKKDLVAYYNLLLVGLFGDQKVFAGPPRWTWGGWRCTSKPRRWQSRCWPSPMATRSSMEAMSLSTQPPGSKNWVVTNKPPFCDSSNRFRDMTIFSFSHFPSPKILADLKRACQDLLFEVLHPKM